MRRTVRPKDGLSACSAGTLGELLVCADLIKRGYFVFRAVAPCGCDLCFTDEERTFFVEVRSSASSRTYEQAKRLYRQKFDRDKFKGKNYDVVAVVHRIKGKIKYIPSLH